MTSNPVTQLRAPRYLAPHTGSNSHHPCVGHCSAQSAGPPKNKYMDLLPAGGCSAWLLQSRDWDKHYALPLWYPLKGY